MGQVLHGSATTTAAVRRAIQHSQENLRGLARRYEINPKIVAKWKKRGSVANMPAGPKDAKSTVLSAEEEAIIVAFRRHTLLPIDDCLYALQATIPHLTRSPLPRSLRRNGISRLPDVGGGQPPTGLSTVVRDLWVTKRGTMAADPVSQLRTPHEPIPERATNPTKPSLLREQNLQRSGPTSHLRHPHLPRRQFNVVGHAALHEISAGPSLTLAARTRLSTY